MLRSFLLPAAFLLFATPSHAEEKLSLFCISEGTASFGYLNSNDNFDTLIFDRYYIVKDQLVNDKEEYMIASTNPTKTLIVSQKIQTFLASVYQWTITVDMFGLEVTKLYRTGQKLTDGQFVPVSAETFECVDPDISAIPVMQP